MIPAGAQDALLKLLGPKGVLDKPQELYPDGVWLARLPQVSFAGARGIDAGAGLMKPEGDAAGVLGADVLAHFRLRFDFPAGKLIAQPIP